MKPRAKRSEGESPVGEEEPAISLSAPSVGMQKTVTLDILSASAATPVSYVIERVSTRVIMVVVMVVTQPDCLPTLVRVTQA